MTKLNVIFQSVWQEGIIETNAKFNSETNVVDNIKTSKSGAEYEHLISEFIIYENELYSVEVNDATNDYYLSDEIFKEFKLNNPSIIC